MKCVVDPEKLKLQPLAQQAAYHSSGQNLYHEIDSLSQPKWRLLKLENVL